jgi:hypothetical protein
MSDSKITQLPAVTTLAAGDLITVVTDPGGTPANKKMTYGDLETELLAAVPLTAAGNEGEVQFNTGGLLSGHSRFFYTPGGINNVLTVQQGPFNSQNAIIQLDSENGQAGQVLDFSVGGSSQSTISRPGNGSGLDFSSGNNLRFRPDGAGSTFEMGSSAFTMVNQGPGMSITMRASNSSFINFMDDSGGTYYGGLQCGGDTSTDVWLNVGTPSKTWIFDTNGHLTTPGYLGIGITPLQPLQVKVASNLNLFVHDNGSTVGLTAADDPFGNVVPMVFGALHHHFANGPVGIKADPYAGETNNASALLQLDSTTQGLLPPRLTTAERNAIGTPATGLQIYNTDTLSLESYNGTSWVGGGSTSPAGNNTDIQFNNSGAFGGSDLFTFDLPSRLMTIVGIGASATAFNLTSEIDVGHNTFGPDLIIASGTDGTPATNKVTTGGNLYLTAGQATSTAGSPTNTSQGGNLYLTSGSSAGSNTQLRGGDIILTTGDGFGNSEELSGGDIILQTGLAQGGSNPVGGSIILRTGVAQNFSSGQTLTGGSITLTTGDTAQSSSANMVGGSITLTTADPTGGTDTGGDVTITSFNPANGGNLYLTGDGTDHGQVGIGTLTPDASASLDITSTTRGFLPPRMTSTERDGITAVTGLQVHNTTTNQPEVYNGLIWSAIGSVVQVVSNSLGSHTTIPGSTPTLALSAGITMTSITNKLVIVSNNEFDTGSGNDTSFQHVGTGLTNNTVIGTRDSSGNGLQSITLIDICTPGTLTPQTYSVQVTGTTTVNYPTNNNWRNTIYLIELRA